MRGTTNSDLDILKDPSIRPQVIEPIEITDVIGLNSAINLQESLPQPMGYKHATAMRYSDDFQRSSLLKKHPIEH